MPSLDLTAIEEIERRVGARMLSGIVDIEFSIIGGKRNGVFSRMHWGS
jgi:hypothetical protein